MFAVEGTIGAFDYSSDGDDSKSLAWSTHMIQVFKNEYEFSMEIRMGGKGKDIPGGENRTYR